MSMRQVRRWFSSDVETLALSPAFPARNLGEELLAAGEGVDRSHRAAFERVDDGKRQPLAGKLVALRQLPEIVVRLHKHVRQHIRLYLAPDLVPPVVAKAFVYGIPLRALRLKPVHLRLLRRALGRALVVVRYLLLEAPTFVAQLVSVLLELGRQLRERPLAFVVGKLRRTLLKVPRHGLLRLLETPD